MRVQITMTVDTDAGGEKALIRQLTLAIARRLDWSTSATAVFLSRDRRTVERRLRQWGVDAHAERARARERKVVRRRRRRGVPSSGPLTVVPEAV